MKKRYLFLFLLSSFSILVSLCFSYFQQDEWHTFGVLQAYGVNEYIRAGSNIVDLIFNSRIGSRAMIVGLFGLFGPNGAVFGLTSGLLHILNSVLIFWITFKLTKNRKMSYVASLFFLINSVASQSFMWFGTMTGTLPSMTFVLLSFNFYLKFIEKKRQATLLISVLLLFMSFLFKEGAYSMFGVYPIIWVLYTENKSIQTFIKDNILILGYGLFNTALYLKTFIFIPGDRVNYIAPQEGGGIIRLLSHLFFYPFEGLSQIFIPSNLIFDISKKITEIFFPQISAGTIDFDIFYTVKIANYLSIFLTILLIISFWITYSKLKKRISPIYLKTLIISFIIITLSFIPVAVLDVSNAYLDSRYYYPSLFGAAIFLGVFSILLIESFKDKSYKKLAIGILVIFMSYHAFVLGSDFYDQIKSSQERIKIIDSIKKDVPKLKEKTIFYVSGNSDGYYGLPDVKVPFQSGLGEMLMVIYNDPQVSSFFKEQTQIETFNGGFLWDILAQGYREKGDRGFGYFIDKKELEKTVVKYDIDISESVFAFYYDSKSRKLLNITTNFRKEIEKDINE